VTTNNLTVSGNSYSFRLVSSNAVDYTTQFGWYLDLPSSSTTGERVAYNPSVLNGIFIAVTLIPSVTPCLAGGSSWVMALNAYTGAAPSQPTFDINADGNVTGADTIALGSGSSATTNIPAGEQVSSTGINTTPTFVQDQLDPTKTHFYSSSSNGGVAEGVLKTPTGSTGRIDWHEINK